MTLESLHTGLLSQEHTTRGENLTVRGRSETEELILERRDTKTFTVQGIFLVRIHTALFPLRASQRALITPRSCFSAERFRAERTDDP